jgi:hypothetical protein
VGQQINSLDAMVLGFTPLCFSVIYLPAILLVHALGKAITGLTVAVYALVAGFIGFIMSPLP